MAQAREAAPGPAPSGQDCTTTKTKPDTKLPKLKGRHKALGSPPPQSLAAIFSVIAFASLAGLSALVGPSAVGASPSSSPSPSPSPSTSSQAQQQDNIPSQQQDMPHSQSISHKSPLNARQFGDSINDIQIECNSNNIVVTLQTNQGFNGMIYPKGLSKNSSCMTEYHQMSANITYLLPLKSCNTMSTDVEDGIEYFNTVMVQPHRRLVTNQGRGYHIRCRYQTKERTITNQEQQLSVNLTQSTPAVLGSATMPTCSMRIYSSSDLQREVSAANVKIGDELQLVIGLDDQQDVYGMLVTNCLVRDGMNWGEQPLIDERGCPVDDEIMPEFAYSANLSRASVAFQAHKFPYTSSVYYQCNVRLCFLDGGCSHIPPNCGGQQQLGAGQRSSPNKYKSASVEAGSNEVDPLAGVPSQLSNHKQRSSARTRRWVDGGDLDAVASGEQLRTRPRPGDLTIEVSSGLQVADSELEPKLDEPTAAALTSSRGDDSDPMLAAAATPEEDQAPSNSAGPAAATATTTITNAKQERQQSEREFCMSLRRFAIIVSLVSLLLMTAIIIMIACLIQRRNKRKLESQMQSTYDQHQSHHINRAYCRD